MTSLSTPKSWDIPDRPPPLPDPDTKAEDIITINVQGKDYYFSPDHVKRYPKLLDPDAKFLLSFKAILPIIYGYPASAIDPHLLDENFEKQRFLAACEFLDIHLTDDLILHLSKALRDEVQSCSDFIQSRIGTKGKEKIRYTHRREVAEFCAQNFDALFRQHGSEVRPIEVISYLEIGTKDLLDTIVTLDFKTKNLILPLIRKFSESFLG